MGKYNSSLTRVVPLLNFLQISDNFPNNLISLVNNEYAITEQPQEIRYGKNEKTIMPSKKLLSYLIKNSRILNQIALGIDDGTETYKLRKELFSSDINTINTALDLLNKDNVCLNKWYVFEGYTHPDIYIETKNYIILGEAKRTERTFTTKTKWLNARDQLIRHIDSVLDMGKEVISFLIIDEDLLKTEDYVIGLENYKKREYFQKNLPHRNKNEIDIAMKTYIGFSTWQRFQYKYGIEYIDEIEDV